MKNTQRGFIVPLLLIIIALLLVGGGAYIYTQKKDASPTANGNVELPQATSTEQTTTVTTQTTSATQPSITVLSPNGGETWKVGQVYTISWQPAIGVGSIQIIADKNALCGEAPCLKVHDGYIAEGVGKYTFTLNDIQPGKYYVRLNTVVGGPTIYSNQFTIATAAPKTTSTTAPYIKSAQISSSIDGPMILYVYGTGFNSSLRVYVSGNGLSNFLMPVSTYASENGSNGTSITVVLPSTMDSTKQYNIYVSNGSTVSNTVSTPSHG